MFNTRNFNSIDISDDDALFCSGPASWNQRHSPVTPPSSVATTTTSVTQPTTAGNNTGKPARSPTSRPVTSQLHLFNANRPTTEDMGRNGPGRNRSNDTQVGEERASGGQPLVSAAPIHIPVSREGGAIPPASRLQSTDIGQAAGLQPTNISLNAGCDEPVVRRKEFKDKENKNKNGIVAPNTGAGKRRETGVLNPIQTSSNGGWKPTLQVKKYANDVVNGGETQRKVENNSKQKKDNLNRNNYAQNHLVSTSANNSDDSLAMNIPMPSGLDPYCDPRSLSHHIYVKNNNVNKNGAGQQTNKGDPIYVHHNVGKATNAGSDEDETSLKVCDTPNLTRYHNIWTKNSGNVNKSDNKPRNESAMIHNDLETDSVPGQNENMTLLKLSHPTRIIASPSSSADLQSIVVSYEPKSARSLSDSSLNLHGSSLRSASLGNSPGNSPIDITTVSMSTVPPSAIQTTPIARPYMVNTGLPSNLNTSMLFGNGSAMSPADSGQGSLNQDFIMAQRLQDMFDAEAAETLRRQRQQENQEENGDVPQFYGEIENNFEENPGFRTGDFLPSGAFPNFDSINRTDIAPVYDPNQREGNSLSPRQSAHLYIPCSHLSQVRRDNNAESLTSERPEITIPVSRLHTTDTSPVSSVPVEPIHIPHIVEDSELREDNEREDGVATVVSLTQEHDTQFARQMQEESDAELARFLQEQDESPLLPRNEGSRFVARGTSYDTQRPLRSFITHDTRPLEVGPRGFRGQINNNVADNGRHSRERPLNIRHNRFRRNDDDDEYARLEPVHNIAERDGYDIPGGDFYYRYQEYDPDFMQDEYGEDRLVSINRDPQLLASLLMTRAPDMMIPGNVDMNDYEALWELAENLGEVRRVGMESSDISRLPVHVYQPSASSGSDGDSKTDCLVCMEEFQTGERLMTLPCCHLYHVDCIDEWLKRNAICPICRQPAKSSS